MSRDEKGKLVSRPDSFAPPIPVRLRKPDRGEFEALALEMNASPSVLARQIISEWLEAQRQASKSIALQGVG